MLGRNRYLFLDLIVGRLGSPAKPFIKVMKRSLTEFVRSWSSYFKKVREVKLIHEAATIKQQWYDLDGSSDYSSALLIQ